MENRFIVSIIGRSNVGKSSLINHLCNDYISSESNKPETTRTNIYFETLIDNNKFLFIDTPGLSTKGKDLLSVSIKKSYIKSLEEIDLAVILTDLRTKKEFEKNIIEILKSNNINFLIAVNKIDLFKDSAEKYKEYKAFIKNLFQHEIFFISLLNNKGIEDFIKKGIIQKAQKVKNKNSKKLFTDKDEIILVQELIRGIIINNTQKEIPYDVAVKINEYKTLKKINKIDASIFVEKSNQRKILIGSNGNMIKLIGSKSRSLLESKYNKKFFLKLNVYIKRNWKNNFPFLKSIGYVN